MCGPVRVRPVQRLWHAGNSPARIQLKHWQLVQSGPELLCGMHAEHNLFKHRADLQVKGYGRPKLQAPRNVSLLRPLLLARQLRGLMLEASWCLPCRGAGG